MWCYVRSVRLEGKQHQPLLAAEAENPVPNLGTYLYRGVGEPVVQPAAVLISSARSRSGGRLLPWAIPRREKGGKR